MKKIFLFVVVLLAAAFVSFASTEEVDVYAFLYRNAVTNSAQLDILQHMAEARLIGAGEFYAQALRRLVSEYNNIRDITERNAAAEQAMILAALLGAERYTQAAPDLWQVVERFTNYPLVRAEALMALGRIRAVDYLPQVIRVLESMNVGAPGGDNLYGERVAFGAIISLEKFGNAQGYLPVFYSSSGWYSRRIRDQATRSLPLISRNPTDFMMQVVNGSAHSIALKLNALQTIEASQVDNADKSRIAVAALAEGWRINVNNQQERLMLANMRKLAIDMINRYRSDDEAIYGLLEQSYSNITRVDTQERLAAIAALASQRTDEAARILSGFLGAVDANGRFPPTSLNGRRQSGVTTRDDEQMVRAIIPALGQTGRIAARPALMAVSNAGWTNAVITLARNALREIN